MPQTSSLPFLARPEPPLHDANGNTQTKTDAAGTTTYAWDYENRLTQVTLPGTGGTVSFTYDPLGRRARKITPTTTTVFAYDGANIIEETDSTGNAVARYAQGLNIDEPMATLRASATHFYNADGLGSITSLTDSSGATSATYRYDTFGNLAASTGSVVNPFRYTSREWDSEVSLYFHRARYYSPEIGRFLSEDPIQFKSGNNFSSYVHNNPINFIDPFGLRDYNEQETMQLFLQPAYRDATAGFFNGLWNVRNHSTGGGDFDFAHNEHASDTFTRCGVKMSAGDFGNYIAGFQAGAWDNAYYGDREIGFSLDHLYQLRYAEALARLAGVYYHITGDTNVDGDPWDKRGFPWITLGADDGRAFSQKGGGCGCNN